MPNTVTGPGARDPLQYAHGLQVPVQEKTQGRSRAPDWIRTELDALKTIHQSLGRLTANEMQDDLPAWQFDPDLVEVRDAESLSEWQSFSVAA